MQALDKILALTDSVEACLDEGDWLAAAELNQRRQVLLVEVLAQRDSSHLEPGTRDALREVLARNQASVARLQAQRQELAGVQQRLKNGRAAVRAYRRNEATEAWQGEP